MTIDCFDYFAASSYLYEPDHIQRRVIDYLVGDQSPLEQFAALSAIKDPTAKVEMLALAQLSVKSYAQSGDPRAKTAGIRDAVAGLKDNFQVRLNRDVGSLGLLPALPDLKELPEWSFAIHLKFTLRQPYYSRDDSSFYLLENPIRKEKVFRLPYIAPTQWKGTLRSVMVRQLAARWEDSGAASATKADPKQFIRWRARLFSMFGTERAFDLKPDKPQPNKRTEKKKKQLSYLDQRLPESLAVAKYRRYIRRYFAQNGFLAGRLRFYPSFFTQIGLEVINPHSRKTGAGELPILFETIPKGAIADFTLLYVPHDCVGKPPEEMAGEVAEDLQLIACGLHEMFCLYGFGAKTTSGFGRADEAVEGKLVVRSKDDALRRALRGQPGTAEKQAAQSPLPKYLEAPDRLKPEYLNPDGTLREIREAELQQFGKKAKQEYDKARRWWLAQVPKTKDVLGDKSKRGDAWPEASFKSFAEMETIVSRIAEALRKGE